MVVSARCFSLIFLFFFSPELIAKTPRVVSRQDAKFSSYISLRLCDFACNLLTALQNLCYVSHQDAKTPSFLLTFLCDFATLRAIFSLLFETSAMFLIKTPRVVSRQDAKTPRFLLTFLCDFACNFFCSSKSNLLNA